MGSQTLKTATKATTVPSFTKSPAASYASKKNAELQVAHFQGKTYEGIKTRYLNTYKNKPATTKAAINTKLTAAKTVWKNDPVRSLIKTAADLCLPTPGTIEIGRIRIDDSVQRLLDLEHGFNIVAKWDWAQMNPPCVYLDPQTGDAVCFDGQHTSFAFWFITTQILGLSEQTKIPVMIYDASVMARVRELFVTINKGDNKQPVEAVDIWRQLVLGYRLDGANSADHVKAEKLQQIMDQYDLFLTNEKFGDHTQKGACHRFREWNEYTTDVAEIYARYFSLSGLGQRRASESNEQDILFELFKQIKEAGINLTDQDLLELYNWMANSFGADFSPATTGKNAYAGSLFYQQCRNSFNNWWTQYSTRFSVINEKPRFSTKYYIYGFVYLTASLIAAVKAGKLKLSQLPSQWQYVNHEGYAPLAKDLI